VTRPDAGRDAGRRAPSTAAAPAVTVGIPTHNRAGLVGEALESVLAQTFADYEIVVVDNGSTDDTVAVLEPYRGRIRYVWQENAGRAGARNRLIELARGRYVAFLDSDDSWLPDKLERQVAVLEREPHVGMVHGHVVVVDDGGREIPRLTAFHRRLWTAANAGPATYARYARESRCLTSTTMFRRDVLRSLGGYDPGVALEDVDLYLRLVLEAEVRFLDGAPVARYRYHASQTATAELARGQIEVCRKHLALLDERAVPDARLARRNFELALARTYHVLLDREAAREHLGRAIALDRRLLRDREVLRQVAASLLPVRLAHRARVLRGTDVAGPA
jgi:glycosyltransferase involved in cell wall biosynthesis